eukprot:gnl/TRDRNA2_/TRDRNA2_70430_c0_seq1.p1 gnl/TRDRNA2_/TRDRNA2_70430_c0~~gnl/TRDRNA2_/TRDRNA2_70430_c0_seq1.p1  ORF type:complete len:372 (-),score=131.14 gnl/TRDRNA2_/TRDRNA2_70430_c0_seq1:75-1109(-)
MAVAACLLIAFLVVSASARGLPAAESTRRMHRISALEVAAGRSAGRQQAMKAAETKPKFDLKKMLEKQKPVVGGIDEVKKILRKKLSEELEEYAAMKSDLEECDANMHKVEKKYLDGKKAIEEKMKDLDDAKYRYRKFKEEKLRKAKKNLRDQNFEESLKLHVVKKEPVNTPLKISPGMDRQDRQRLRMQKEVEDERQTMQFVRTQLAKEEEDRDLASAKAQEAAKAALKTAASAISSAGSQAAADAEAETDAEAQDPNDDPDTQEEAQKDVDEAKYELKKVKKKLVTLKKEFEVWDGKCRGSAGNTMSYEDRVKARQGEIDAMKDALRMLEEDPDSVAGMSIG